MATVSRFEELKVWQAAERLVRAIYSATNEGGFAKDFGLKDQTRRSAVSTLSNIAEGFERGTNREFIQFLSIAKGSNGELRAQLYVALGQEYISQTAFESLRSESEILSRQLATFIRYLQGRATARRLRDPA
jgi:four helix bundle protein